MTARIHYPALQALDVICTTDLSFVAWMIRRVDWKLRGWPAWASLDRSTHTTPICDRGAGLLYACEMTGSPDDPVMTELHCYSGRFPWSKRIVTVRRHPLLAPGSADAADRRRHANDFMIRKHSERVRYGFETVFKHLGWQIPDDPYTMVCSQWTAAVLAEAGVILPWPAPWDTVTPRMIQTCGDLVDIQWRA